MRITRDSVRKHKKTNNSRKAEGRKVVDGDLLIPDPCSFIKSNYSGIVTIKIPPEWRLSLAQSATGGCVLHRNKRVNE